jgi:hypothetical protein
MSDHEEESADQSEEIFRELLVAEREQEITQTTTMQGQIVSLVLILRDVGVLSKEHVDAWEEKSEHVTALMFKMAKANEIQSSDCEDDPEGQLEAMLDGVQATLEFTRLMGNSDEDLASLIARRDQLVAALEELRREP